MPLLACWLVRSVGSVCYVSAFQRKTVVIASTFRFELCALRHRLDCWCCLNDHWLPLITIPYLSTALALLTPRPRAALVCLTLVTRSTGTTVAAALSVGPRARVIACAKPNGFYLQYTPYSRQNISSRVGSDVGTTWTTASAFVAS